MQKYNIKIGFFNKDLREMTFQKNPIMRNSFL